MSLNLSFDSICKGLKSFSALCARAYLPKSSFILAKKPVDSGWV